MKNKKMKNSTIKKIGIISLSTFMLAGMVMQMSDGITKNNVSIEAGVKYDGKFTYSGNEYTYLDNGTELTLVSVTGSGDLSIPSSYVVNGKTKSITKLGDSFGSLSSFRNVYIPDSVTEIGDDVFLISNINYLRISSNVKKIGRNFCSSARVSEVTCTSTKIESIGLNAFEDSYSDKERNIDYVVLGDWLVKYRVKNNTLDLSGAAYKDIRHVCEGAIICTEIDTVKLTTNNFFIITNAKNFDYFPKENYKNIKYIYLNGEKVMCNNPTDKVPNVIKYNYDLFVDSKFEDYYARSKAKAILTSLGIKYYGAKGQSIKGTLTPNEEFEIVKKVSNYLIQNYIYDVDKAIDDYYRAFNCSDYVVCRHDAAINAFLLENAGVETEVVHTGKLTEISKEEWDKINPDDEEFGGKLISSDGTRYYKSQYGGCHAWNVVKINGEWYHVDVTSLRTDASRVEFLVSDSYFQERASLFSDCSMDGYRGIHGYPYYANLPMKEKYVWQTTAYEFKSTDCKKTIGNVNDDLYIDQTDIDMIQAYTLLSSKYKKIVADVYEGKYKPSSDEIKKINASANNTKLIDSNGKSLINTRVIDTNFDGCVDMSDVLEMKDRMRHIKTIQWGDLKR